MAFFSKKKKNDAQQGPAVPGPGSSLLGAGPPISPPPGAMANPTALTYGNAYQHHPNHQQGGFQDPHQPVYMQTVPPPGTGSSVQNVQGPASSAPNGSFGYLQHSMNGYHSTGALYNAADRAGPTGPGATSQTSPQQSNHPNGAGPRMQSQQQPQMFPSSSAPSLLPGGLSQSSGPGEQQQGVTLSSSSSRPAGAPSSHPVSYPWSQRQIRLAPVQPVSNEAGANNTTNADSPSPFPRYGHSVNPLALSSTGDLYLFGGLVKDQVKNDLYMINCGATHPQTGQLTTDSKILAASPINISLVETRGEVPCPRVGHTSVSVGNVLIVWGGDTKTHEEDTQDHNLYLLNLGTRDWTLVKVSGPAPPGRYGHAAAIRGSKFYIFGGQQDVPPGTPDELSFMNDLWCFDLQNLKAGKPTWTKIEYAPGALVPPKRTGQTMVNYADGLYIFGGTDGQYHYNDTWCCNTTNGTWSELSCIGYIPVPREGHAATLVDDVVYVFGGRSVDGKDLDDLAAFKISNQRWYMFTNMGPAPAGRSGHAMASWNNKVFVLGGESYTSTKHEWPNLVHMLDTGKIKYPSDSRLGNRKSSNPKLAGQQLPNKTIQNVAADDARRAASPTGSDRDPSLINGLKTSVTKALPTGVGTSPIRNTPSPTQNPVGLRNVSDSSRRGMSPINEGASAEEGATRSFSPTGSSYAASQSLQSITNLNSTSTPPMRSQSIMNGPASPIPTQSINALRAGQRSPSPISNQPAMQSFNAFVQPEDSYARKPSMTASNGSSGADDLAILRKREKWMQAALAAATAKGFALHDSDISPEGLASAGGNQELIQAVLALKQELAEMRATMAEEAVHAEKRLAQAISARSVAVQEAVFYKTKVNALESGSGDVQKLDATRLTELERRLIEATSAKTALERRLQQLEDELEQQKHLAQAASERENAHMERAEAAEASYSRSLTDYADLQRRAHGHESSLQEHVSKLAALEASLAEMTANHSSISSKHSDAQETLEHHVRLLESAQDSLNASMAHSGDMEALYENSRAELAEHQERSISMQADLQKALDQLQDAQIRNEELERALQSSKQESQQLRILTADHLAETLNTTKAIQERSAVNDDASNELVQALRSEIESHRNLATEAHTRVSTAQAEAREAKSQHIQLEKQISLLRSELSSLRSRHAHALHASTRAQTLLTQRDLNLREKARAIEAAEVKAGILRSLLAENGLAAADEQGSPALSSSGESSAALNRKVAELQTRLDQRTQTQQELQSQHEAARKEAESSQSSLRASEEQISRLQSEMNQLKLASSQSQAMGSAANKSLEDELASLQDKHQQLEATHMKAVQYVKGTEKMFRRMKDELTKYKEKNEALESQLAHKSSEAPEHSRSPSSAELRPELENLRAQLQQLRQHSEDSTAQNEELQAHIRSLKSEYDSSLSESKNGHSDKVSQYQSEIEQLSSSLAKAQRELEETLTLNRQLNSQLQVALKGPQSPTTNQPDEPWSEAKRKLETDLQAAVNRSEWLKRENAALEDRVRESESKVSLLLDHIEGSGGVEAVASSVGHSTDHEHAEGRQWKGNHVKTRSDAGSDYSHSVDSFQQLQQNGR